MSEEIPDAAVGAFLSAFDQLWRAGTSLEERTRVGLAATYPHLTTLIEATARTEERRALLGIVEEAGHVSGETVTAWQRGYEACSQRIQAALAVYRGKDPAGPSSAPVGSPVPEAVS